MLHHEIAEEELLALFAMANQFRSMIGAQILPTLLKGVRAEPGMCLVAKAFGNCDVDPSHKDNGVIAFTYIDHNEIYRRVSGASVHPRWPESKWESSLTPQLNKVALDFDNGAYPQYEEGGEKFAVQLA